MDLAAAKSELIGQVRAFVNWVGAGRKLTQTGRITLADARMLVEALGTDDVIDPTIGNRVFRTTSSQELLHLRSSWSGPSRRGLFARRVTGWCR
jgi:hypothetical protein